MIREIHDITGVGVLFVATPVWDKAFQSAEMRGVLAQTENRKLIHARLPDRPTVAQLAKFAKHFGLAPAEKGTEERDLQDHVTRNDSLGRWVTILEGASRIATKQKEPMSWEHVLQCNAALLELEEG